VFKKINFELERLEGIICLRGFEPYFSIAVNKATKQQRIYCFQAVLLEQRRQKETGVSDVDLLRSVACQASQWAKGNALQLGANDESAAIMIATHARVEELVERASKKNAHKTFQRSTPSRTSSLTRADTFQLAAASRSC
jgi:hypothetical protein